MDFFFFFSIEGFRKEDSVIFGVTLCADCYGEFEIVVSGRLFLGIVNFFFFFLFNFLRPDYQGKVLESLQSSVSFFLTCRSLLRGRLDRYDELFFKLH